MKLLLTGAFGYKGTVLLPKLKASGHEVITLDTGWFGGTPDIRQDIRELRQVPKVDAVIHLANIANDPCGELDAKLTWEVNVLALKWLLDACVEKGVGQFIFASSASVYGLKDNKPVNEDTDMTPVSDYNKTKMIAEKVIQSYGRKIRTQILRPATVCGVSPRMRLDVVVNALTIRALVDGVIPVMTPDLYRPHCHIDDVTDIYCWMLETGEKGPFNAGFTNQTILETAAIVAKHTGAKIEIQQHTASKYDKRSYCVDSSRIQDAGYKPKKNVEDAIREMVAAGIKDEPTAYNLAHMRKIGVVAG